MKTKLDNKLVELEERLKTHTQDSYSPTCQCSSCIEIRKEILIIREHQKFVDLILFHSDCRKPHLVKGNYVSCLIMILAEITKEEHWNLVKKLNAELKLYAKNRRALVL